ncbi:amidohydrolase [Actinosynnema pretiosum subsp. pretiosum]|uniref:Amidohydrolase n=2 Tax=Actinosynnema TaxID=40566 RepID=C6WKG4_ACTMD|nr:amidohydrolase [Actinosynnema mirum]ACU40215.1 amidohydrolase [Actinosynnema mirum DSM 43827]AXX33727.1 N-acyl-L-amino acid amidohydrolase AmiA1 [Actinosynnema pretiosum subsp. pretiosum]QUF02498.1 amidohydrolase [Actinosynnema pretiosum subsp. pretiosum]
MTILDSRPELPSEKGSEVLLTERGVSIAPVDDLGEGRGPSWLDDWLSANGSEVIAWRRHIHAHPELSRKEYRTTELIGDVLRSAGLKPRVLPGGTGLVCDVGSGPRCVALRADIDALPLRENTGAPYASKVDGVSHACGHDAHTTVLLGAALALASATELPGRVRLVFQPAEEIMPGGALDVLAAGGLDGVERIFGLHCDPRLQAGRIGTRVGAITSASDLLELRLTSPGGHTSRPHLTADLVHALGTVITGLPTLLSRRVDPRSGTVLVWGAVHAGEAANAVPQDGVLRGTLRTGDRDIWAELEPLVKELVSSLLAPLGVGFDLHHRRGVPPVVNDRESTMLLRAGIEAALGEDALAGTQQSSGGEDFGWYLEHVPGSFARLGVWDGEEPPRDLHQPTFNLDERALMVGVRVMVHTALAALA